MIKVYCDESHDDTTYALAGLIATPTSWDAFTPAWQTMLDTLGAPAFHASEIENREIVSDSRYKDWDRPKAVEAFTQAVDVVVDPTKCKLLWAVGASIVLPRYPPDAPGRIDKDEVWILLFVRVFQALVESFGPQHGIDIIFDDKPEVRRIVNVSFDIAKPRVNAISPGKLETLTFGSDDTVLPLQAADLFVYEWRKRISDKRNRPNKPMRTSYQRIIQRLDADGRAVLHHYSADTLKAIYERKGTGENFVDVMFNYPTTRD
jgi:hypothetical protein